MNSNLYRIFKRKHFINLVTKYGLMVGDMVAFTLLLGAIVLLWALIKVS